MKVISLFNGIGGFEKGFLDAGYNFESYWSENDKYASAVYRYNFPNSNELGDATKIKLRNLPDFDILTAGFPCQSFSIAGKRQGFKDVRGTLFYEIIRICKEKKPKILLLENVDGIISHDNYATIITIHTLLSDIGYKGGWVVYNSKNFGLPQNRSRCFFIYYFGKEPSSEIFFIGESNQKINEKKIQYSKNISGTINTKNNSGQLNFDRGTTLIFRGGDKKHQGQRIYDKNGIACQLKTVGGGLYMVKNGVRRLTPIEAEGCQGFPKNWTKYGIDEKGNKIEISDTQRYRQIGNAVSCNVIAAIAKKLL